MSVTKRERDKHQLVRLTAFTVAAMWDGVDAAHRQLSRDAKCKGELPKCEVVEAYLSRERQANDDYN